MRDAPVAIDFAQTHGEADTKAASLSAGLGDEFGPHHIMAAAKATSAPAVTASPRKSNPAPGLWWRNIRLPRSAYRPRCPCIAAAAAGRTSPCPARDAREWREDRDVARRPPKFSRRALIRISSVLGARSVMGLVSLCVQRTSGAARARQGGEKKELGRRARGHRHRPKTLARQGSDRGPGQQTPPHQQPPFGSAPPFRLSAPGRRNSDRLEAVHYAQLHVPGRFDGPGTKKTKRGRMFDAKGALA